MAKYDALRDYLARRSGPAAEVAMGFAEVEALVGPLPASARTHRAWWANDSKVQALAWRAAGWQVDSVNQDAERVVFIRTTTTGEDASARQQQVVRPRDREASAEGDRSVAAGTDLTEATIQAHLVRYLEGVGWQITRQANTATKERGIDVLANLGARTLAIEVKGYPGTRYADVRRAAEVKPTAPPTQARHWYAQAILKAMLTRSDHPEYELAIALPRMPTYEALVARTSLSLEQLDIALLFVGTDGAVDPHLTARRAPPTV